MFRLTYVSISVGCISKSGIVGSDYMHMFTSSRYCQNSFRSDYTILHSYHQYMRVLVALHAVSFFNLFIYSFLATLGLCCCAQAFPSCGEWGLLFVAVHGLLIVLASLVAEHGL